MDTWLIVVGVIAGVLLLCCLVQWLASRGEIENGQGKVVLITGCDSGFGERLVDEADSRGFNVVAACYTAEGAAKFDQRTKVRGVVADLTQKDGIDSVVAAVKDEVSRDTKQLWAVVNNAGLVLPANVEWAHPSSYHKVFDVNFFAPVTLVYELFPLLKDSMAFFRQSKSQAKPRVINVTSVDGIVSLPTNASYATSKFALEAYSDALRIEMREWGLDVSCVEPATMRTPLAMGFGDAWMKGFREAPADRTKDYGDAWAEEMHKNTNDGIESVAADPMETVSVISKMLVQNHPPFRIATGAMGKFFFSPVSRLPTGMAESIIHGATLNTKNKPVGLQ